MKVSEFLDRVNEMLEQGIIQEDNDVWIEIGESVYENVTPYPDEVTGNLIIYQCSRSRSDE